MRSELEGFETVRLSAGALKAEFAHALGMAAVSLRHRGAELLAAFPFPLAELEGVLSMQELTARQLAPA